MESEEIVEKEEVKVESEDLTGEELYKRQEEILDIKFEKRKKREENLNNAMKSLKKLINFYFSEEKFEKLKYIDNLLEKTSKYTKNKIEGLRVKHELYEARFKYFKNELD